MYQEAQQNSRSLCSGGGEKQNSGIRTGSSPSFVTSYGTWDSYFSFSKVQFPYLRNEDKSYVIELL